MRRCVLSLARLFPESEAEHAQASRSAATFLSETVLLNFLSDFCVFKQSNVWSKSRERRPLRASKNSSTLAWPAVSVRSRFMDARMGGFSRIRHLDNRATFVAGRIRGIV